MKKLLLASSLFSLSIGCSNNGGSSNGVQLNQLADTGTQTDILGTWSQACTAGAFTVAGFANTGTAAATTDAGTDTGSAADTDPSADADLGDGVDTGPVAGAGSDTDSSTEAGADTGAGAETAPVSGTGTAGGGDVTDVGGTDESADAQASQNQSAQSKESQQRQSQAKAEQEQQEQEQSQTDSEGETPAASGAGIATQNFLKVSGDKMILVTRGYSSADCSGAHVAEAKVEMDYKIPSYTAGANNDVDLELKTGTLRFISAEAADQAGDDRICGLSNWKADQERSILGTRCLTNMPTTRGASISQVLNYGGGNLTFGVLDENRGSSDANRPTALSSVPFTRNGAVDIGSDDSEEEVADLGDLADEINN